MDPISLQGCEVNTLEPVGGVRWSAQFAQPVDVGFEGK